MARPARQPQPDSNQEREPIEHGDIRTLLDVIIQSKKPEDFQAALRIFKEKLNPLIFPERVSDQIELLPLETMAQEDLKGKRITLLYLNQVLTEAIPRYFVDEKSPEQSTPEEVQQIIAERLQKYRSGLLFFQALHKKTTSASGKKIIEAVLEAFDHYYENYKSLIENDTRLEKEKLDGKKALDELLRGFITGAFTVHIDTYGNPVFSQDTYNQAYWKLPKDQALVLQAAFNNYAKHFPEGTILKLQFRGKKSESADSQQQAEAVKDKKIINRLQVIQAIRVASITSNEHLDKALDSSRRITELQTLLAQAVALQDRYRQGVTSSVNKITQLEESLRQLEIQIEEHTKKGDEGTAANEVLSKTVRDLEIEKQNLTHELQVQRDSLTQQEQQLLDAEGSQTRLIAEAQQLREQLDTAYFKEEQLRKLLADVGHGELDDSVNRLILSLHAGYTPDGTLPEKSQEILGKIFAKVLQATQIPIDTKQITPSTPKPDLGPNLLLAPQWAAEIFSVLATAVVIYSGSRHYLEIDESKMYVFLSVLLAMCNHKLINEQIYKYLANNTAISVRRLALGLILATGEITAGVTNLEADATGVAVSREVETGTEAMKNKFTEQLTNVRLQINKLRDEALESANNALSTEKSDGGMGPKYRALACYYNPDLPYEETLDPTYLVDDKNSPGKKVLKPVSATSVNTRYQSAMQQREASGLKNKISFETWLQSRVKIIENLSEAAQTTMDKISRIAEQNADMDIWDVKFTQVISALTSDVTAASLGYVRIDREGINNELGNLFKQLGEIRTEIILLQKQIIDIELGYETLKIDLNPPKEKGSEQPDRQKTETAQTATSPVDLTNGLTDLEDSVNALSTLDIDEAEALGILLLPDHPKLNEVLVWGGYITVVEGLSLFFGSLATSLRRRSVENRASEFEIKIAIAEDAIVNKLTLIVSGILNFAANKNQEPGASARGINHAFIREWLTARLSQAAQEHHGLLPSTNGNTLTDKLRAGTRTVQKASHQALDFAGLTPVDSNQLVELRYRAQFSKDILQILGKDAKLTGIADVLHALSPGLGNLFVDMVHQYEPGTYSLPVRERTSGIADMLDFNSMFADMTVYLQTRLEQLLDLQRISSETTGAMRNIGIERDQETQLVSNADVTALWEHYRIAELIAETRKLLDTFASHEVRLPTTSNQLAQNAVRRALKDTLEGVKTELTKEERDSLHQLISEIDTKVAELISNAKTNSLIPNDIDLHASITPGSHGLKLKIAMYKNGHPVSEALFAESIPTQLTKPAVREKYINKLTHWFDSNGMALLLGQSDHQAVLTELARVESSLMTANSLIFSFEDFDTFSARGLFPHMINFVRLQHISHSQMTALSKPEIYSYSDRTITNEASAHLPIWVENLETTLRTINTVAQEHKTKFSFEIDLKAETVTIYERSRMPLSNPKIVTAIKLSDNYKSDVQKTLAEQISA